LGIPPRRGKNVVRGLTQVNLNDENKGPEHTELVGTGSTLKKAKKKQKGIA